VANRNFPQSKVWGFHLLPRKLDARVAIGSTGAPTLANSLGGIASITRLSAGTYRLQLQDNYASFLGFKVNFESPVTGSALAVDASDALLSVGTVYQIVTLGTSTQADWVALGLPSGITAAVGQVFKAAATGAGTGSGTVKAIGKSGIRVVEIVGDPNLMLSNQPAVPLSGGFITFQCLADTDSSTTTLIPTDPASGSTMFIELLMNDSQVQ